MDTSKFKDGQKVRVIRKVEKEEGWGTEWADAMDRCVGMEGIVHHVDTIATPTSPCYGVAVKCREYPGNPYSEYGVYWWYPVSALEIIE